LKGQQHRILTTAFLVSAAVSCAKVEASPDGTGGTGGVHVGSGGTDGGGFDAPGVDQGPVEKFETEVMTCEMIDFKFEPKIPTVMLLVDRSGTMFHCLTGNTDNALCADPTNTSWSNLKTAIKSVMKQLEGQVRFGFTTIWGTSPTSGGMCPSLKGMPTDAVPAALNNADAIAKVYDGLALPPSDSMGGRDMGKKFESPASESIAVATKTLLADTTVGDKYIIFLTDGQPDYCDDSNILCAPDSVVYQLQTAFTAGVKTIVFGVQTSLFDLPPGVLQAFANAGAGEATLPPIRTGQTINDLYDQCNPVAPWAADLAASGKTNVRGTTLGTYGTTMGPSKPFMPSASNLTQLVTQLTAALSNVKSCTFDLGNINGKSIKVNRAMLNQAHIKIMGGDVPLSDTNGWKMNTDTELELTGSACTTWRDPATNLIEFDFPCEIFIVG
jgi:hypothetical protein